jgi:hypothetical protein
MNEAGDIAYAWDRCRLDHGHLLQLDAALEGRRRSRFRRQRLVEATSIFKAATGIASLVLGNTHVFFSRDRHRRGRRPRVRTGHPIPNVQQTFCSGDGSGTALPVREQRTSRTRLRQLQPS